MAPGKLRLLRSCLFRLVPSFRPASVHRLHLAISIVQPSSSILYINTIHPYNHHHQPSSSSPRIDGSNALCSLGSVRVLPSRPTIHSAPSMHLPAAIRDNASSVHTHTYTSSVPVLRTLYEQISSRSSGLYSVHTCIHLVWYILHGI